MHETAISLLRSKLPFVLPRLESAILDVTDHRGDLVLTVVPESIRDTISFLKTNADLPFQVMIDLFGIDYLKWPVEMPERFAVIYNLYSITHHRRVQLKAYLPETNPKIDSIHQIYRAANWFERETWDMYGIGFNGHPNLLRILCHVDFVGHPLRKDYPADQYQRLKNAAPPSGF